MKNYEKKINPSIKKRRRRSRINITSLLVLFIVLICIYTCTGFSFSENSISTVDENIKIQEYPVKSGDTLWDIAMKYKGKSEDPREYINNLMSMNQMDTGKIYSGQVLTIYITSER